MFEGQVNFNMGNSITEDLFKNTPAANQHVGYNPTLDVTMVDRGPSATRQYIVQRPYGTLNVQYGGGRLRVSLDRSTQHGVVVEEALKAGLPVPPEVLRDYPELAAKAAPKPAIAPEQAVQAAPTTIEPPPASILHGRTNAVPTPPEAVVKPALIAPEPIKETGQMLTQGAPVPTTEGATQPQLLKTPGETAPTLPRDLAGAKPRYKTQTLNFQSDVDKALYIVGNTKQLSKRDADYMTFLRDQFPDRADSELRRMGMIVRTAAGKRAGTNATEQVAVLHKDVENQLKIMQKNATPTSKPIPSLEPNPNGATRPPVWAGGEAAATKGQRAEPTGVQYPPPSEPPAPPSGEPPELPSGRQPGGPERMQPHMSPDPYEQLKAARTATQLTPSEKIADTGNRLLRESYDKTWDLKPLEEATGIPVYKLAALVNGAVAYGEALARKHVVPVFNQVGKNVQALEDYMIAMRLQDILARNPQAKLPGDIDQWRGALGALEGVKRRLSSIDLTAVETAARNLWRLNDELVLKAKLEEGLISKAKYNAIKAANPHYISFYREEYTGLQTGLERGSKIASISDDGIEALDLAGSTRKLDKPLARFQAQVIHTQKLISQNRAARALAGSLVSLQEIGAKGGARAPLQSGETWARILNPSEAAEQSNIWGTISYFDKGEKVTVQVPKLYADIAKSIEAETANSLVSFLRAASTPLRAGAVTFNVAFTPKNVIRDAISAWFREGVTPWSKEYMDGWRAAWQMEQSDTFMEAAKDGVLMSGIVETMRDTKALSVANRLGAIQVHNAKDALLLFPRLVERFGVMSEQTTRLATYQTLKHRGVDELSRAVRSRDVSVDFAKSGNFMKMVNQAIPFANAGVQGAANVLRTIKSNPKQAIVASAPLVTMTAMTYAWNQRYESFKDVSGHERYNNWVIMMGEGQQNPDPQYPNKPGKKFPIYIKIPKGPLGSFVTSPFETLMDVAWRTDNRSVLDHLLEGAAGSASALLPIEPSALLTPLGNTGAGIFTGVDPWTKQDVVPKSEQARFAKAPEFQYGPETSRTAVLLEQALSLGGRYHVSPRLIEWAIKDYTAGVGQQSLWLTDLALGALGFDPKAFGEGQRRELTPLEQAAKLPVASGFIGTRGTGQRNLGWEEFDRAVGESERQFAQIPTLRDLNMMPGQVSDRITLGKVAVILEPVERAELQRSSTAKMMERATPMLNDPRFSELPVQLQKKLLSSAFAAVRERARMEYIAKIPKAQLDQRIRESRTVSP